MADTKDSNSLPEWTPTSWKAFPIQQQPQYEDQEEARRALEKVAQLPPLVHPVEVESLRKQLAAVARGERFLLQGGDCAERFMDCTDTSIEAKLKIILQMSLVLVWGARVPTVRIGRVAGQYGKPRSSPTEVVKGKEIPSYKGDNINGYEPTKEARAHDPKRLVEAHFHSACTLNYMRALIRGGYADLHQAEHWDLGYVADMDQRQEYQAITQRILDALDFMKTCGVADLEHLGTIDYFTSHEGLVLDYETAVTKKQGSRYYNTGAHFLWIGDRTRQIDSAHVEYFRGIANPIGVKVGPSTEPQVLVQLLRKLNFNDEPGRVSLITRFGAGNVSKMLPPVIKAVQEAKLNVVWVCDPMHGNTLKTADGTKTRSFDAVLTELTETFSVHVQAGSRLGGVHFELTGEDVTECVGGPQQLNAHDLDKNYQTFCDPRLNYAQSMEMSFKLSQLLADAKAGKFGGTGPSRDAQPSPRSEVLETSLKGKSAPASAAIKSKGKAS